MATSRPTARLTPRHNRLVALLLAALAALAWPSGAVRAQLVCGTPGKDGPGGTLSGVVNSYWPGTASAAAGATSITVGAAVGSVAITPGDLLLVIQMQDAEISARNNARYGANGATGSGATAYYATGAYEYVVATTSLGTAGGTVGVRGANGGGLLNGYTDAAPNGTSAGQRRFQVIRVPQYSSATFSSGLTAAAWTGRAGGVLAVEVAGALTLGGTVSVNGKGFRGGAGRQFNGGSGGTNDDYRSPAASAFHASKGEGAAGTPQYVYDGFALGNTGVDGYPSGSSAMGAPATAGGGGTDGNPAANDENSGGGGGSNAGAGGSGGNSWNSALAVGGRGGSAYPYGASTGFLLLGGGGGAGTSNNGTGARASGLSSSGAPGGGIVIVRAGTVTGAGTITANGLSADNSVFIDGSGGGGAGGSVLVYAAQGGLGLLTVEARGGDGGTNSAGTRGAHGPGGGGGGGFVALSSTATTDVRGGANGTTSNGAAYGATAGASGTVTTVAASGIRGASTTAACVPALSVIKTTSTPIVSAGGSATYTITVSNAAQRDTARQVAITDSLPAGMSFASALAPVLAGGASRPTTVAPTAGATQPSFGTFSIPGGGSVTITLTVTVAASTAAGTHQNFAAATYLDPKRTAAAGTAVVTYDGAASAGEEVTVVGAPNLRVTMTHAGNFVVGRTGAYTITVSNPGTAATAGLVTLLDTLPAGLNFAAASGTGWTCGAVGRVVTCTIATVLAAGASYAPITLTVTPTAPATVTNTARVAGGGEPAFNAGDNAADDPTTIVQVSVAVTPDGGTADQLPSNGTRYTHTFTVTNGGSAADSYLLAASAGPGTTVTVVSTNGQAGASGGTVSIAAGASQLVALVYTVGNQAAGATDTLRLTASSATDPTATDAGSLVVRVVRARLEMSKELFRDDRSTLIAAADRVLPGEFVQYRVTVRSVGTSGAVTVHVVDPLPSDLVYDSAAPDAAGWAIAAPGGTLTADLAGSLPAGASRHFWLRVRVK